MDELLLAGTVALIVTVSTVNAQTVVYDSGFPSQPSGWAFSHDRGESSSTDELPGGYEENSAQGHHIVLAGTARRVVQIDVRFFASITMPGPPVRFDGVLKFFSVGVDDLPDQLLWTGVADDLSFAPGIAGRTRAFSFFPDVDVPDQFFVSISEEDVQWPSDANGSWGWGWRPTTVPSIGSAGPWATLDATGWHPNDDLNTGPTSPSTLELRIHAVPQPGMLAMFAPVAVAGMARRRRRM